jgi:hypothetical protein
MGLDDKLQKYIEEAQIRAARRKSPWNLLLLLHWPVAAALWIGQLNLLHRFFSAKPCTENILRCVPERGVEVTIFMVAPLIPSIALSMILTNALLWMIKPARRVFESEAQAFPEASYRNAQKKLAVAALIAIALCDGLAAWAAGKI